MSSASCDPCPAARRGAQDPRGSEAWGGRADAADAFVQFFFYINLIYK
jgi:hypothetical protein